MAALRIDADDSSCRVAYDGEEKPKVVTQKHGHPQRHQHIIQLLLLHQFLDCSTLFQFPLLPLPLLSLSLSLYKATAYSTDLIQRPMSRERNKYEVGSIKFIASHRQYFLQNFRIIFQIFQ